MVHEEWTDSFTYESTYDLACLCFSLKQKGTIGDNSSWFNNSLSNGGPMIHVDLLICSESTNSHTTSDFNLLWLISIQFMIHFLLTLD